MATSSPTPKGKRESAAFTVDTQLFRELGELLVGRDATALLELVKNSYDADASAVTIHGQDLDSPARGYIRVSDDGTGMTLAEFRNGFLRLAGRTKATGDRRSSLYGRRYTGEKGVGRLAAHKLARVIEVDSLPFSPDRKRLRAVRARIDWGALERRRTLEQAGEEIVVETYVAHAGRGPGTDIGLSALRHAWTHEDRTRFVAGAGAFSPPQALVGSLRGTVPSSKLLFVKPKIRDQKRGGVRDPGFEIRLTGDFAFAGEHWDELLESVEWVLEIDARPDGVTFSMAPTERELVTTAGQAQAQSFDVNHPDPRSGPFFQARIVVRGRGRGSDIFRNWSAAVAGVRVYSEGFRVLPYGEPDNDWLEMNRDYAARSRQLRLIDANRQLEEEVRWEDDDDLGLTMLPSDSYVGAILITREKSGELEMLVNREGFVPNRAFDNLKDLSRLGVDLLTRARAAGRHARREEAKIGRERSDPGDAPADTSPPPEDETPAPSSWTEELSASLESTRVEIVSLRTSMAAGNTAAAEEELERLEEDTERIAAAVNALIAEQRLTPILASVGIQMAEFVHEINGLLAMANSTDAVLSRLREDPSNFGSAAARQAVAETHQTVRDLRGRLERQASYLIDLTSPSAVRRRSRQRLGERLDRAAELVRPALDRRNISLVNRVAPDIRTPAMFPAELTAVLLNLLTNAVKAAEEDGRIIVRAHRTSDKGYVRLRIENTGQALDIKDSERWFRPFETTTTDVDPLLGQGMGFGLPITRGILEEYGAHVRFIKPRKGYATAVQVEFPS